MRKLIALAGLVVVGVFAAVGVAYGASGNTSSLDAKFNPPSTGAAFTKGGLFVETSTQKTGDPNPATNPSEFPSPTTLADVDFDQNIKFTPAAVPSCTADLTGDSTQAAMKACGDSAVGGGYATVCGNSTGTPGGACDLGVLKAQITAFNGPHNGGPGGNLPTILLHSRTDISPVGPITVVLVGSLKNSPLGGEFGKRLDVPVPLIPPAAPGLAAITDFAVNVNSGTFVQAKCTGDDTWNFSATLKYNNNKKDTVTKDQACS
jgi:hypothetical protein